MPEPGKATLNVDPDMVAEVRLEVAKRLQRGQKTSMGALVREAWNAYLSAPVVPAGTSSTATQYSKGDPRVRELHQLVDELAALENNEAIEIAQGNIRSILGVFKSMAKKKTDASSTRTAQKSSKEGRDSRGAGSQERDHTDVRTLPRR